MQNTFHIKHTIMEKKKADIVIYGNLICEQKLTVGGGKLYLQNDVNTLTEFFDIDGACVIHGDLQVESFSAGDLCVVVCGYVAAKGGGDGTL